MGWMLTSVPSRQARQTAGTMSSRMPCPPGTFEFKQVGWSRLTLYNAYPIKFQGSPEVYFFC